MKNVLTIDGRTFVDMPIIDSSIELQVYDVDEQCIEGVKAKLASLYGDTTLVADGSKVTASELVPCAIVTCPALDNFSKPRYTAADVVRVIARLARDGDGCPWDRVQTHDSIRINMIEEAYEAVDAIDKRDLPNMREEFGDVFLQSVLQAEIAKKQGEFDFDDVCDELCKKLIGRHTFIFGQDCANSSSDALNLWERAKATEKNYDTPASQLRRMPQNFPALLLCEKTYKKLKKAGVAPDPQAMLQEAQKAGDLTKVIAAATALLADSGKDAEVELNGYIKGVIAELE